MLKKGSHNFSVPIMFEYFIKEDIFLYYLCSYLTYKTTTNTQAFYFT